MRTIITTLLFLLFFHSGLLAQESNWILLEINDKEQVEQIKTQFTSKVFQQITPSFFLIKDNENQRSLTSIKAKYQIHVPTISPLLDEINEAEAIDYIHETYALTGANVVVGVGDGGMINNHLDFENRINNQTTTDIWGSHKYAVAGIIGGGAVVDSSELGIAPDCGLVTQYTVNILSNLFNYDTISNFVATNNSYGVINCTTNGKYNSASKFVDEVSLTYPYVLNVFAAGNSGANNNCTTDGFGTVLGYYQTAKNGLTVGAVSGTHDYYDASGKGPTLDGRVKPEIVGVGKSVVSTVENNAYSTVSGTSYAAPAVTGVAALLAEQYIQDEGMRPKSSLIKALLCNTATDLGEDYVDYKYGFGLVNGKNAFEALENEQYVLDEIENESKSFDIVNTENEHTIKFMLYWHDDAFLDYGQVGLKNLLQDLDIKVITPDGDTILPYVLNPDLPSNMAQRKIDTLNNIEQVVIESAEVGTYEVIISGSNMFGPQSFVMTHAFIAAAVEDGGEILPVELLTFDAKSERGKAILNWTTVSEFNNEGFEIQQSFENSAFEPVGFVEGKGESTELEHYNFHTALNEAGRYYYRLKQIDFDGTFAYSPIVHLDFNLLNILVLENEVQWNHEVDYMLYQVNGQMLKQGKNNRLDLGYLLPGMYILNWKSGNHWQSKKIIR